MRGPGVPGVANAHTGLHADGTLAGLGHRLSGLHHILAAVAVGFRPGTLGNRDSWIVPSSSS
ncbi:urease accessory protein [Mesorhizobium robiniae]|uniref:Urease accessory protein n=1 Tax=Mesorhizobium robiniae TaxID=559315 RepID=A0ABV2GZK0_9HYPH|nr:HupE/UreJ family protein [Mesorhizobium sp. ZC-5]MCV3243592.1 HupE/UreJ family protein [Mesorhizobium sp. ZC-5]